MKPPISAMGGKSLFELSNDFSLMSHEMKSRVGVSQFVHIAFIETDEKGTRAAAATAAEVVAGAPVPFTFNADRPFVFFVWERRTKTILFLGVVNDPSQ
jgi:serpin B